VADLDEVYVRLLQDMSEARKGTPDARIETTLKSMRAELIAALRRGADELGKLDFRESPGANSRRNAEVELIEMMVATMGGTN
jgi:hypothetical protein